MRFWICQKCSRLFWSDRKACDICSGELLQFQNANAELYIKTLGFSQVGVPELSALDESLDSLFERHKEKDRQAQKDAQDALEKSRRKQNNEQAPGTKRPHGEETYPGPRHPRGEDPSAGTIAQQQREREQQRKKTEEMRKKLLQGRGGQEKNTADRSSVRKPADHQSSEAKPSRPEPRSGPQPERKTAGVRETLSKLGLRKKGISVE